MTLTYPVVQSCLRGGEMGKCPAEGNHTAQDWVLFLGLLSSLVSVRYRRIQRTVLRIFKCHLIYYNFKSLTAARDRILLR